MEGKLKSTGEEGDALLGVKAQGLRALRLSCLPEEAVLEGSGLTSKAISIDHRVSP